MKIGLVLDDTLDSSDGVQQYVLLVGDWLKQQGHDVHYIVGSTNRKDIDNIHSFTRNIKVRFNKNRLSVPLPASSRALKTLLNKDKFDILHVQMPFSPFLAGKVIKYCQTNTAIVGTFHIAPHGKSVVFGTRMLGRIQKTSLRRLDKVISVSEVAQDFALSTQNIHSVIIPNAIDYKQWLPPIKVKKIYDIAFVGRLVPRKGCIYLLRAVKQMVDGCKITNFKVVIVGDGPKRAELTKYVTQNNLSKYCQFEGYVSEKRKREILQSTRLAVFPATGGESFGIVLLEAMSAGATVLAGNNPGYSEVLGSLQESLFDPKNINNFAERVVTLLSDTKKYNSLKVAQQKLVKRFDINAVGSAILKIYNQVRK